MGDNAPTAGDLVAFADNPCGNLFNNIYFNCGGQTISQITNGVPQIDIVKSRLTKNSVYNKSIGVAQGLAGHWYDRRKLLVTPPASGAANNVTIESAVKEAYQTGKNTRDFIWQPSLGIFDYSEPLGSGEYEIQLNPSQDYKLSCVDTGVSNVNKKVPADVGIA